ncbi:MAG: uroporphyrinogen-III C-methyltransferase [Candidatus Riflebacteria bacterium]|nr:uroporphyrinogen-III C-methyltransferase [Candidatus Riflebacteria bacterium]
MSKGKVFLVGSGPGDPGLLTLKGKDLLEKADVIIFDRLGGTENIEFAKKSAELIDVGKQSGLHNIPQEKINEILVKKALEGKNVVRLKGGDPMVFGRGAEELQALITENIDFEIVPGVSSAISGPTYAGIPITHRDFASSLAIITGHEAVGKPESSIPWSSLAEMDTILILMGVGNLKKITEKLLENGKSSDSPVAIIENATVGSQRVAEGTLANILGIAEKAKIKSPALIVIGECVKLREKFSWFERRPLFGKQFIITRPLEQSFELASLLQAAGSKVFVCPTIRIEPIEPNPGLHNFFENLPDFRDLIFTSVNGVRIFWKKLQELGKDARILAGKNLICIGPATAQETKKFGVNPDFVPERYVSEEFIPFFRGLKPAKVACLRAERARDFLPLELKKMGYEVEIFPLYKTIFEDNIDSEVVDCLNANKIDGVVFTSSSTVEGFVAASDAKKIDREKIRGLAIGPITGETCRQMGIQVLCESSEYTSKGLVNAITSFFNPLKK